MILVADSGSTKTEWCMVENGEIIGHRFTSGINPFYQTQDEILTELKKEWPQEVRILHLKIYFYGTGCANEQKNAVVAKALELFFKTSAITIHSDLVGAAHALCQNKEGIACILGTGSNSCYYNGWEIVKNVSPLGFILGDEGSGAVIGKKLVSDILKYQLPQYIIDLFYSSQGITSGEIMEAVYRKPFPNRYLAQFTKFIYGHIDQPELENIVIQSFDDFIRRNIMQYPQAQKVEIHFTGSIAWYFQKQLKDILQKYDLIPGNIIKAPLNNLLAYHTRNI